MKKLAPPILFFLCLGLMGLLRWRGPLATVFPAPYHLLGILFIAAGLTLGLSAARHFHKLGTNIRPFTDADKLVTDGPFHYTRNPMYLGLALTLTGTWILLGCLSLILGPILFVIVASRWPIAFEERMLHRKFGPAFEAYRARTRRWI